METLQDLLRRQQDVERQIREAQDSMRAGAIAEIRNLMHAHGLTVADLVGTSSASKRKGKSDGTRRTVAAKYRHPESGVTWSGRGLKPRWLNEELAKGKTLEDFAL